MIAIEDQRRTESHLRYIGNGDVFEYEGDVYIKLNAEIQYNVTKNEKVSLNEYTNVYEVKEAVLCLS